MANRARRYELHEKLKAICENVYFQPPNKAQIKYPCIIYDEDVGRAERADNRLYLNTDSYMVTVIDKDPDSVIPGKLMNEFSMIRKNRPYRADNLNHYPHTLYY